MRDGTILAGGPAKGRGAAAAGGRTDAARGGRDPAPALVVDGRLDGGDPAGPVIALHGIAPRDTATGTLIYDPVAYRMTEMQSILRPDPINDAVLLSQGELLRGLPIVEQVAEQLHLFDRPEFNPALHHRGAAARVLGWMKRWLAPRARCHRAAVGSVLEDARGRRC